MWWHLNFPRKLREALRSSLWQGDPLHVLAGGDICFAPPFGNRDEEVLSVGDHTHCVYVCDDAHCVS